MLGIISRSKLSEGQVNKEEMLRHEKKRDFLFNMPTTLKKSDVRDLNEKCYLKIKSLRVMLEIFNFFFLQQFSGRDMNLTGDWSSVRCYRRESPDIIVCQRTRHVHKKEN